MSVQTTFVDPCTSMPIVDQLLEEVKTVPRDYNLHDSTLINEEQRVSGSASISIFESTCKILIKNEDPAYEYIRARVYHVPFPKRWTKEGIAKPNISAIENTKEVCCLLYKNFGLIPFSIVPTKEEGLALFYEHFESNYSLNIEIYNDLDIAGLVNDNTNKRVIVSKDIINLNFTELIKAFYS